MNNNLLNLLDREQQQTIYNIMSSPSLLEIMEDIAQYSEDASKYSKDSRATIFITIISGKIFETFSVIDYANKHNIDFDEVPINVVVQIVNEGRKFVDEHSCYIDFLVDQYNENSLDLDLYLKENSEHMGKMFDLILEVSCFVMLAAFSSAKMDKLNEGLELERKIKQ